MLISRIEYFLYVIFIQVSEILVRNSSIWLDSTILNLSNTWPGVWGTRPGYTSVSIFQFVQVLIWYSWASFAYFSAHMTISGTSLSFCLTRSRLLWLGTGSLTASGGHHSEVCKSHGKQQKSAHQVKMSNNFNNYYSQETLKARWLKGLADMRTMP